LPAVPEHVQEACEQFRQGDLFSDPPIAIVVDLANPLGADAEAEAAALHAEENGEELTIEPIVLSDVRFGIVVSQTCDIRSDARTTIKIAPVYELDDPDAVESPRRAEKRRQRIASIEKGRMVHRIMLDGPAGYWFADLETVTTVEKSILLNQQAIPGFSTADGYRGFAFRSGHVHDRPAVPSPVDHAVVGRLRTFLMELRQNDEETFRRLSASLAEEALLLDDWEAPTRAQLWFLGEDPLAPDLVELLEVWHQALPALDGVAVLPNRYDVFPNVRADEYRDLRVISYWYLSLDEDAP
jgi:hypothetical protein